MSLEVELAQLRRALFFSVLPFCFFPQSLRCRCRLGFPLHSFIVAPFLVERERLYHLQAHSPPFSSNLDIRSLFGSMGLRISLLFITLILFFYWLCETLEIGSQQWLEQLAKSNHFTYFIAPNS